MPKIIPLSPIRTVGESALFEHLTESFTQFEITLALCTFKELFHLVSTWILLYCLLLIHGLLLVHGLRLMRLLKNSFRTCYLWPIVEDRTTEVIYGKKREKTFNL